MRFEENYEGFVTNIARAIQRMYPCPDNEVESGMTRSDEITYKTALATVWQAAAGHHQLSEILTKSVTDDLNYIQVLERSVRRMNNPKDEGAYGIVSLFDTISGFDILKKIVETGNRRLSLATSGRLLGNDILYLEEEPNELDIAWLMDKKILKEVRYIAFPWKGNVKVLIVGNHPHSESYFRESWFIGYKHGRDKFPKHFVDCYSLDGTPWHSEYTKFNAFVVDEYENIEGVVELLDLMEHLSCIVECMVEMLELSIRAMSFESDKFKRGMNVNRIDIAKDLIPESEGFNRKILKHYMTEYLTLYRKIQAHEFYSNGMITSFVDHLVKYDYFFDGLCKLSKSDIEGIVEIPIDDISLEE